MQSRIAVLALATIALVGTVSTVEAGARPMLVRGETSPPIGAVQFCHENPRDCGSYKAPNKVVRLTQATFDKLKSVNLTVNRAVVPATDKETYGRIEYWTYPGLMGDCEDYALEKRRELTRAGWPASAMLLTVVRDEAGDGHAVLTVRTDRGDLILDNKTDSVLVWDQTPYHFVKRQSAKAPTAWDQIEDSRNIMVGSVR